MTTENPSQADIEVEKLLSALRELGGSSGNKRLKESLGWETDYYYEVRNRAESQGLVARGRGKGGSTRLVERLADEELLQEETPEGRRGEDSLYAPVKAVLESDWVKDSKEGPFESLGVVDVARQGKRKTGGRWTRPDLALIAAQKLDFFPTDHFEIITFEVKPADAVDPTGVYEALSHRRSAHRSILIVCADDLQDLDTNKMDEVQEVAHEHGIGLIRVVGEVSDYDNWETLETAARVEPDPIRANAFISTQLEELHEPLRQRLQSLTNELIREVGIKLRER